MREKKRKTGIMGGTFDPIHIGHLILGESAYDQFGLDRILFMPAGNPPHKRDRRGRASDEERVEMVRRAIADNPHFELCTIEMEQEGYSYTYRTLEKLRALCPDDEFYFILGADSLFDFESWREPQRICDACKIIVATRNQTSRQQLNRQIRRLAGKFQGEFLCLDNPDLEISSAAIRDWIREGKSIRYYLSGSVLSYIREKGIYL